MSSLQVATTATSPSLRRKVISTDLVWTGAIVDIKVPSGANVGVYDQGSTQIPFLQFPRYVSGGAINIFVHTDDESVRGRTIRARASVMGKTFEGGQIYLHVDLAPVSQDFAVTHRFVTVDACDKQGEEGWVVFNTPDPIKGAIVFAPLDAKLAPSTPEPVARASDSKDPPLDRLIAAGWTIESENDKSVTLVKSGKRPITHFRPVRPKKKK